MVRSAVSHKEQKRMNDIRVREVVEDRRRLLKGQKALTEFQTELDGIDWTAEDSTAQYDDAIRRFSFQANMHPQTAKAFDAIHNATLQNRAMTDRRLVQSAQTAAIGSLMREYPDIGGTITAKMRRGEDVDWEDVYSKVETRKEKDRQREVEQYRARGEAYYGARNPETAAYEPTDWDKAELSDLFSRRRELRSEISKLQVTSSRSPDSKRLLNTFEKELEDVQSNIQSMQGRFTGGTPGGQTTSPQPQGENMSNADLQNALMQRFLQKYGTDEEGQ